MLGFIKSFQPFEANALNERHNSPIIPVVLVRIWGGGGGGGGGGERERVEEEVEEEEEQDGEGRERGRERKTEGR